MAKNPNVIKTNRKKRSGTASVIADIAGVSPSYVRKVMNGDRENDDILNGTILYEQMHSKLIQKIKQLVPFN